jgi:hypothetical protein
MSNYIRFLFIVLCSCSRGIDQSVNEVSLEGNISQSVKEEISRQYQNLYYLDTLEYQFSYQYQLLGDVKIWAEVNEFNLQDIYIRDSTYHLRLTAGLFPIIHMDLSLEKELIVDLIENNRTSDILSANVPEMIIVFTLEHIQKTDITFGFEDWGDEYSGPQLSIEPMASNRFVAVGKIIGLYTINQ